MGPIPIPMARRTQHRHEEQETLIDVADLLTAKQRVFADEMLRPGATARAAYIKAYGPKNPASADPLASRLLKNVKIARYLDQKRTELSRSAVMSAEEVLLELSKIARFNIKTILNTDGSVKQIYEIEDDNAAAIQSVEVSEIFDGSQGEQKHVIGISRKIKTHDKRAALVDLGKYHKLFTDKIEATGPDGKPIQHDVALNIVFVDADES